MRTFYTGSDIEDLAASGVRQLEVGPGVSLTDAARERAEELGVALVTPGSCVSQQKPRYRLRPAKSVSLPAKPRGCQHGPSVRKSADSQSAASGGPVVDQLVEAVSALKKRGG